MNMATKTSKDYLFVGLQFVLFVAYAFDFRSMSVARPDVLGYLGLLIAISGVCTGVLALIQLNTSLSPFPTPLDNGQLVTSGVFGLARHPIYTSLLMSAFGYALYLGSGYRMLIGLALLALFYFKSSYEEELLGERYPGYVEYSKRVGRFLRWL